jgi:hypothetical protein
VFQLVFVFATKENGGGLAWSVSDYSSTSHKHLGQREKMNQGPTVGKNISRYRCYRSTRFELGVTFHIFSKRPSNVATKANDGESTRRRSDWVDEASSWPNESVHQRNQAVAHPHTTTVCVTARSKLDRQRKLIVTRARSPAHPSNSQSHGCATAK